MSNEIEQAKIAAEFWSRVANGEKWDVLISGLQRFNHVTKEWDDAQSASGLGYGGHTYRWKPKTVKHPDGEYPEPCNSVSEILDAKHVYAPSWIIDGDGIKASCVPISIDSTRYAYVAAKSGLLHIGKENAIEHAEYLYLSKTEQNYSTSNYNDDDQYDDLGELEG